MTLLPNIFLVTSVLTETQFNGVHDKPLFEFSMHYMVIFNMAVFGCFGGVESLLLCFGPYFSWQKYNKTRAPVVFSFICCVTEQNDWSEWALASETQMYYQWPAMAGRLVNGYNQELLVIPCDKGLKSSERLDGNKNCMSRHQEALLEQSHLHSQLRYLRWWGPVMQQP